jgi:hypothetical protein
VDENNLAKLAKVGVYLLNLKRMFSGSEEGNPRHSFLGLSFSGTLKVED